MTNKKSHKNKEYKIQLRSLVEWRECCLIWKTPLDWWLCGGCVGVVDVVVWWMCWCGGCGGVRVWWMWLCGSVVV